MIQELNQAPIYQLKMANGDWRDQNENAYRYNVMHRPTDVRIVYAAPAIPQAAGDAGQALTYHFHRFVNGEERAEDILIQRATTIEAAIKEAVKCCPKQPMTVLVHAPAWVGTLHGGAFAALAPQSVKGDERAAFEAWKNDPRFYDWNTNEQHAELNFKAGWQASAAVPQAGAPYLPCPICNGVEGCDHTVPERARAAGAALTDEQIRSVWSRTNGMVLSADVNEGHLIAFARALLAAHNGGGE